MKKLALRLLPVILLGGLVMVALPRFVGAQAKPPLAHDDDPPMPAFEESGELPDELRDLAFDRFVDLGQLGEALHDMNPSLMCDVALQLAEGERVLLRPHKAVAAAEVRQFTLQLAVELRDTPTLRRLAEYAKRAGDATLQADVDQAIALSAAPRKGKIKLQADSSVTLEQFTFMKALIKEIQFAKLSGSSKAMMEVKIKIDGASASKLPGAQKQAVNEKYVAAKQDVDKRAKERPAAAKVAALRENLKAASDARKHGVATDKYTGRVSVVGRTLPYSDPRGTPLAHLWLRCKLDHTRFMDRTDHAPADAIKSWFSSGFSLTARLQYVNTNQKWRLSYGPALPYVQKDYLLYDGTRLANLINTRDMDKGTMQSFGFAVQTDNEPGVWYPGSYASTQR